MHEDDLSKLLKLQSKLFKKSGSLALSDLFNNAYLEIIKLRALVAASRCPCCDGSGAYYDHSGEATQCQWCDETKELRKNHDLEQQTEGACKLIGFLGTVSEPESSSSKSYYDK